MTRETAVLAYRLMLGREPESEEAIRRVMQVPDLATLGRQIAASEEFGRRHGPTAYNVPPFDAPPLEVETEADPADLARLTDRVAACWSALGTTSPHWSVLAQERFRPDSIGAHLGVFYESGAWDARLIDASLARLGRRREEFAHAVDFGCGVGRITLQLARRFAQVTGLDISPPHLALAEAAVREAGHGNVEFRRITGKDLMPVPRCDLWFSLIVLQHDPPPVALEVLRRAFASLEPGGLALFQLPVWCRGYRFRTAEYLAKPPAASMEMHVVPQRAVLQLAHRAGMILRELREDSHITGGSTDMLSNSFVFEKLEAPPRVNAAP